MYYSDKKHDVYFKEDISKYNSNRYSIILVIILTAICISIYFTDFLRSYLIWQVVCLSFYLLYHIISLKNPAKIANHIYIVPMLIFCQYLFVNVLIGGSVIFIFAFILNIVLLIFLTSTPTANVIFARIMALCAFIHLVFTILVEIMPVGIINEIFKIILGSDYWTNWDWRVQQNSNVGITTQPGNNALYLTTLLAFCVAHLMTTNKKNKKTIYWWICLILTVIGIISTTKRAPLVFNAFSIYAVYMIYNRRRINFNKIIKVFAVIIVGLILFFIIYKNTDVFSGVIAKNSYLAISNDISNGRISLWNYALEQFNNNPIFGVGLKTTYDVLGLDVHNVYIQLLAETGIVGFTIFLFALLILVVNSIKNIRYLIYCNEDSVKRSVIMGMYLTIYLISYGLVGNPFIDYIPLGIFVCSIYMANSYRSMKVTR